MKRVLLTVYLVSLCISIVVFIVCNMMTVSLEQASSNGNSSLFFFLGALPFLFIFLYGTIVFMRIFMSQKLNKKEIIIVTIACFFIGVFIYISTAIKVYFFRDTIVKINPFYENSNQVPYLNSHSKYLFFNTSTFIMLVLFAAFMGGIWALKRKKDKKGKIVEG